MDEHADTGTRAATAASPLRRPMPWLLVVVAVLLAVVTGLLGSGAWLLAHPTTLLAMARASLGEGPVELDVRGAAFDRGDGWHAPGSWRWRAAEITILPSRPHQPSVLFEGVVVAPPRLWWSAADGLVVSVPEVTVEHLWLHFEAMVRPAAPPPQGPGRLTLVIDRVLVGTFSLTMREGLNPEVVVDATEVSLVTPFRIKPHGLDLRGELHLGSGRVEVNGVEVRDVHASRIAFTGLGLEAIAAGRLGTAAVDASFSVEPLVGPPRIWLKGRLHEGTMRGLADAILGPGDLQFIGRIALSAELVGGGALGPGRMEGTAHVDATDAGFSRPASHRAAVAMAVHVAPFLRFDEEGNVVVGDFHGGLSFSERGVSFDTMTYEAPHSVGALRGYVGATGMSAKLHFEPRAGSGAIEWGLVLRGDLRKPQVALALPAVLRRWTPCHDPLDCPLEGGRSVGEARQDARDEAEARVEARAEAQADRAEDRLDRRDARRALADAEVP